MSFLTSIFIWFALSFSLAFVSFCSPGLSLLSFTAFYSTSHAFQPSVSLSPLSFPTRFVSLPSFSFLFRESFLSLYFCLAFFRPLFLFIFKIILLIKRFGKERLASFPTWVMQPKLPRPIKFIISGFAPMQLLDRYAQVSNRGSVHPAVCVARDVRDVIWHVWCTTVIGVRSKL